MTIPHLSTLQKAILQHYQQALPSSLTPYAAMAEALGSDEASVLQALQDLQTRGLISRIGPVFDHRRAGASTLAALAVPAAQLEQTALALNQIPGLNHNYEREHEYNLWFVLTAASHTQLQRQLASIRARYPWPLLVLPMEQAYHINLGFPLHWSDATDDRRH